MVKKSLFAVSSRGARTTSCRETCTGRKVTTGAFWCFNHEQNMSDLLDIDKNVKAIKDMLRWLPLAIVFVFARDTDVNTGIIIVIIGGMYYLGDWIAQWYLKRRVINEGVINLLSWTNLIVWVLPPLGIFTASLVYGLCHRSEITSSRRYKILAIIGAVLSIVNGTIAFVL